MKIPKPNLVVITKRVKRVFALPKKKLWIILLVLLVLGGLGGYVYWKVAHPTNAKKTVVMNGKEYVVEDFTTQNLDKNAPSQVKTDYKQEIIDLEQRIQALGGRAPYQDYLALAQLYVATGDSENAIKNYEQVKAKLDPKSAGYREFSQQIDQFIAELRKESE